MALQFLKKNKIFLIGVLIGIGLIVLVKHGVFSSYINLDYIRAHQQLIAKYIAMHYAQSVCIYMFFYIMVVFLMIPLTMLLNIAAGYFFGVFFGTLYSVLSAVVGSLGSVIAIRLVIKKSLQKKYSAKLASFNDNFKKNGARYLLSLQLLPITPFPVISVCTALSGISLWTFVWTAMIGIAPATFLYALAGSQLMVLESGDRILSWNMIGLLTVLSILTLLPLIIHHIKKIRI